MQFISIRLRKYSKLENGCSNQVLKDCGQGTTDDSSVDLHSKVGLLHGLRTLVEFFNRYKVRTPPMKSYKYTFCTVFKFVWRDHFEQGELV